MARSYHQGRYVTVNPEKYVGNKNDIVYRSSWEKRFFVWADLNPSVVKWNSEEVVIPYICSTDGRRHLYYVDAFIMIKSADGRVGKFLVEIKPESQTVAPKFPGKQTRRFLTEMTTYMKNQSKWEAAKKWAKDRGMDFIVITERHLGIKNGNTK
jgi:hypothetical protein